MAYPPSGYRYYHALHNDYPPGWYDTIPLLPWGKAAQSLTSLTVCRNGGEPAWVWTEMFTRFSLGTLTSLKKLALTFMPLTDKTVSSLKDLPLESLDLSSTIVTDAGLLHLVGLTGLTSLDLSSTYVSDLGMPSVASLTVLTSLTLRDTRISDVGLAYLQDLPLTAVELARTSVSTKGLLQLLHHSLQLTSIGTHDFRGNRLQTIKHLTAVVELTVDLMNSDPVDLTRIPWL
jgi:hypothetical protein